MRGWTARRGLRLLGELLLVAAIVLGMERFMTRDAVRGALPPVAVTVIDGERLDLAERARRPALIYFWATWCPVCSAQRGAISDLVGDVPVLTVAMQSGSAREVAAYLAAEGLDWPTVADTDGSLSRRFGVVGVPAVFIIDGDGAIRFVTRGYTTGPGLRLRLWLAGR